MVSAVDSAVAGSSPISASDASLRIAALERQLRACQKTLSQQCSTTPPAEVQLVQSQIAAVQTQIQQANLTSASSDSSAIPITQSVPATSAASSSAQTNSSTVPVSTQVSTQNTQSTQDTPAPRSKYATLGTRLDVTA